MGAEGGGEKNKSCPDPSDPERQIVMPSPRFGAGLVYKSGMLYLFGGLIEDEDKDLTLKDFYSLDANKLDSWNTIIENDIQTMEWFGSEDEDDGDDDDEDEDDDDEEEDMDTD